jgi:hypothetical protein
VQCATLRAQRSASRHPRRPLQAADNSGELAEGAVEEMLTYYGFPE